MTAEAERLAGVHAMTNEKRLQLIRSYYKNESPVHKEVRFLLSIIDELEEENERLREELETYGRYRGNCLSQSINREIRMRNKCKCGLQQALGKGEGPC